VPGPDGVAMAREMNDHLAPAVARHPDRLAGFAALPMQRPDDCADELVRAVKGPALRGCAHQRHDRGPLPRSPEL
jgi:predicted TIM-barrel fold metal-dependent hydrolase